MRREETMSPDSADPSGMAEYYQRLERAHLAPLWESLAALAPPEPRPQSRPFKWSYRDVRAHLMEAGERISAEKAERRVMVLANPSLPGKLQVNDTLYAGLQLILPGETAPPHRHTQAALRFVIEGEGAYTAVDGRRAVMRPGDFIITPAWSWHEHGGGPGPVIWLDGLDVGLVGFLHAEFREEPHDLPPPGGAPAKPGRGAAAHDSWPYEPPSRPSGGLPPGGEDQPFAWPYAEARAELERMRKAGQVDPWRGVRMDYRHADGRPAMTTLGASLTLLPEGFRTRPYKSTDGAAAVVVEGRLEVAAGGERFELGPGDVVALPGWTAFQMTALEQTVVFAFSDEPAHRALGLWREWRGQPG
jgi:gentisate 1,2-dioxygenase